MAKNESFNMKRLWRWLIISLPAALIVGGLGYGYDWIAAMSTVFAASAALIFSAIVLVIAMAVKPGKEAFFDALPTVIIVTAVIGIIGAVWEASPLTFVIELTLPGLAIGFASVFLAAAVVDKYVPMKVGKR